MGGMSGVRGWVSWLPFTRGAARAVATCVASVGVAAGMLVGATPASAAVSGAPTETAASDPLRVASYNMMKVNAPTGPAWTDRFPRLPAIVSNIDPGVVALQEVTNHKSGNTRQRTLVHNTMRGLGYAVLDAPEYNECVRPRDKRGKLAGPNPCDTSVTLAWKPELVSVLDSALPMTGITMAGSIAPVNPDADQRQVAWAFLQFQGRPFLLISTHLENDRSPAGETGRVAFGSAVTAWADQLAAQRGLAGIPMVIAGDLNSYKKRQPAGVQAVLMNAGWSDAYYAAGTRVGERYATINITPKTRKFGGFPPRPFQYSKKREPSRIDYVMFRGGVSADRYETVVRLNPDGTFVEPLRMSDHNAVVADLRFL